VHCLTSLPIQPEEECRTDTPTSQPQRSESRNVSSRHLFLTRVSTDRFHRIKCSIRGEWKHRDQYSKAKLTEYDKKVRYGGATPNKSGIPCRQHAPGAQISEIQCRGPCLKVQARTQFSKNTLSTGKYVSWPLISCVYKADVCDL